MNPLYLRKWNSLAEYLNSPPEKGSRNIRGIVEHHTAIPNHARWAGDRSADVIMRYWRMRSKQLGWRNPLGAHYIVSPAGVIYLCFSHNTVLNANTNGTANRTTLSIEMVGNFDKGHDVLQGVQKETVLGLTVAELRRYGRLPEDVTFHRNYTRTKSCPGTGIIQPEFIRSVRAVFHRHPETEEEMKEVVIEVKGKGTMKGVLDEKAGETYVRVKSVFPGATYSWDKTKSRLEVSPK